MLRAARRGSPAGPRLWQLAACAFLGAALFAACGRRGDPIAPGLRLPGAPAAVSLAGPAGELTLSWSAPRDDLAGRPVIGLSGFSVLRGAWPPDQKPCDTCPEDLEPAATLDREERQARGLPQTSWVDAGARPGWTYRYRVRALDARGRPGPASAAATVTWMPPPTPRAEVIAGDGQAKVRWEAGPTVPGLTPLGTRIYGSQGQRVAEAAPGALETVVAGLENGAPAMLSVRAAVRTSGGWEVESIPALLSVTPSDTTPPLPPSDLVTFAEGAEVSLHWLPAGPEPYAEVWVLRAREGGPFGEIARLPGTVVSYVDTGVEPGQTYLYAVTARDAVGNESLPTRESRVRVPGPAVPSPRSP
ncbi:MAG: fibronectin type III domain-containing protein [Deltaproteobacteria bacterium]|nr:fibronectin type III domain-containing protein [Deltaproteobacteria bacterium]